jgi:hypothetical protein
MQGSFRDAECAKEEAKANESPAYISGQSSACIASSAMPQPVAFSSFATRSAVSGPPMRTPGKPISAQNDFGDRTGRSRLNRQGEKAIALHAL